MKKITLGILLMLIALMLVPMLRIPTAHAQGEQTDTPPDGHIPTWVPEVDAPCDKLVVQDFIPWGGANGLGINDPKYQASVDLDFTTMRVHSETFANPGFVLIDADGKPMWKAIIFVSDQGQVYWDNLALAAAKVSAYVVAGGVLVGNVCDNGWHLGSWAGILPGAVGHVTVYWESLHIVNPLNIFAGMTDLQISGWHWSTHGYFTNLEPGTTILVTIAGEPDMPVYIEYPWGNGLVKATLMTLEWSAQGWSLTQRGVTGIGYTIIQNEIIEAQHWGVSEFALPAFVVTASLFAAVSVFIRRKRRLVTQ